MVDLETLLDISDFREWRKAKETEAATLPYRVDVFCSGGWQHLASFAGETDAYQYGERYALSGARVWHDDECLAVTDGPKSWRAPKHLPNCDEKLCQCGALPPIGSKVLGTWMR